MELKSSYLEEGWAISGWRQLVGGTGSGLFYSVGRGEYIRRWPMVGVGLPTVALEPGAVLQMVLAKYRVIGGTPCFPKAHPGQEA